MSLGGLTTWHDLLHGSAPSFLGGCKRQHCKGVFHVATINPTSYFFFPTRFLQATCLGPSYSNPQERWTCVFLTYLMGFCLTRAFFGCNKFSRCHCRKEAALNRFISENHKNCDLDHMQVQPHQQRALLGRPLPTGSRCFFLSLAANGHRFELGKRFWNGSGSFRKGNRCRNVLKWKLILLVVGFKMF